MTNLEKRLGIITLLTNPKHHYNMSYNPMGYYDRKSLFTDYRCLCIQMKNIHIV